MRCIYCPAADIDDEDITCIIDEKQRELRAYFGEYGCSRRSIEKIKVDIDKCYEEEGKAWEEYYFRGAENEN